MDKPITRKDTLKLGLAAGTVAALGLQRKAKSAPVVPGSRPNILLIVADDMPDRLLPVMKKVQTRLVLKGTTLPQRLHRPAALRTQPRRYAEWSLPP